MTRTQNTASSSETSRVASLFSQPCPQLKGLALHCPLLLWHKSPAVWLAMRKVGNEVGSFPNTCSQAYCLETRSYFQNRNSVLSISLDCNYPSFSRQMSGLGRLGRKCILRSKRENYINSSSNIMSLLWRWGKGLAEENSTALPAFSYEFFKPSSPAS